MQLLRVDIPSFAPYRVMPIGDIQWDGMGGTTALSLLQQSIKAGLEKGAHFCGMGDYIDPFSPSNRQRLEGAALYDTARGVIDQRGVALVEELYEEALAPTKNRWLGLLEGHHFMQLREGDTTDQRLCKLLNAPHLGSCAFIGLNFNGSGNKGGWVVLWVHHGVGSGQRAYAPAAKLETITPYWEADVFIIGHLTKQAAVPMNRVYPMWHGTPHLSHRKKLLIGAGGFSKGYIEYLKHGQTPRGSYVEQKMLNPAALGCPLITIRPSIRKERVGKRDVQIWDPQITVEV